MHKETETLMVRLSSLFTDPALRRFFRDGERDSGFALVIPDPDLTLDGGEALELEEVA
ncbi:hypothetical protein [Pelagibacterium sediminicola]|uniref:hypothetical protein n=1 Tax=Pelagibacterium sediminicola TaxID=2248761 RepID=UPI0018E4E897|nr:hypothetical protein [Pelagibacterium sediminicola]